MLGSRRARRPLNRVEDRTAGAGPSLRSGLRRRILTVCASIIRHLTHSRADAAALIGVLSTLEGELLASADHDLWTGSHRFQQERPLVCRTRWPGGSDRGPTVWSRLVPPLIAVTVTVIVAGGWAFSQVLHVQDQRRDVQERIEQAQQVELLSELRKRASVLGDQQSFPSAHPQILKLFCRDYLALTVPPPDLQTGWERWCEV